MKKEDFKKILFNKKTREVELAIKNGRGLKILKAPNMGPTNSPLGLRKILILSAPGQTKLITRILKIKKKLVS